MYITKQKKWGMKTASTAFWFCEISCLLVGCVCLCHVSTVYPWSKLFLVLLFVQIDLEVRIHCKTMLHVQLSNLPSIVCLRWFCASIWIDQLHPAMFARKGFLANVVVGDASHALGGHVVVCWLKKTLFALPMRIRECSLFRVSLKVNREYSGEKLPGMLGNDNWNCLLIMIWNVRKEGSICCRCWLIEWEKLFLYSKRVCTEETV